MSQGKSKHRAYIKIDKASYTEGQVPIASEKNGYNEKGELKGGKIACNKGFDLTVTVDSDIYKIICEPSVDQYGEPCLRIYTEDA